MDSNHHPLPAIIMNVLGDIYFKFYQYLLPFINQMPVVWPFEFTFIIADPSWRYERNNKCQESVANVYTLCRQPLPNYSFIPLSRLAVRYLDLRIHRNISIRSMRYRWMTFLSFGLDSGNAIGEGRCKFNVTYVWQWSQYIIIKWNGSVSWICLWRHPRDLPFYRLDNYMHVFESQPFSFWKKYFCLSILNSKRLHLVWNFVKYLFRN